MKKKRSNVKDVIISKHFSEMAKKSHIARVKKYGEGYMKELGKRSGEKRKLNAARKHAVVNDDPSKNCPICGFDHSGITDENRLAYTHAHDEHIKSLVPQVADEPSPRGD